MDVFAFGVVAYRMLTGNAPHAEPPLHALLDGREPMPHAPFATVCTALPPRIATLLDACLSSDPQTRPQIAELLEALEHASVAATAASSDLSAASRRTS